MVHEILPCGKENAISGADLVKILELKDVRQLTQIIELERANTPICASTDARKPGYFLPASPGELESYIQSFDRRLGNMQLTRQRLGDALEEMTAQTRIEMW